MRCQLVNFCTVVIHRSSSGPCGLNYSFTNKKSQPSHSCVFKSLFFSFYHQPLQPVLFHHHKSTGRTIANTRKSLASVLIYFPSLFACGLACDINKNHEREIVKKIQLSLFEHRQKNISRK